MRRCASASPASASMRVEPVASVRRMSTATCEGCRPRRSSVFRPDAAPRRAAGSRSAARTRSGPPSERRATGALDNDIHQPCPAPRPPSSASGRWRTSAPPRSRAPRASISSRLAVARTCDVAAQLAVHLHHELDRVLHQRGRIHRGPRLVDAASCPGEARPRARWRCAARSARAAAPRPRALPARRRARRGSRPCRSA